MERLNIESVTYGRYGYLLDEKKKPIKCGTSFDAYFNNIKTIPLRVHFLHEIKRDVLLNVHTLLTKVEMYWLPHNDHMIKIDVFPDAGYSVRYGEMSVIDSDQDEVHEFESTEQLYAYVMSRFYTPQLFAHACTSQFADIMVTCDS